MRFSFSKICTFLVVLLCANQAHSNIVNIGLSGEFTSKISNGDTINFTTPGSALTVDVTRSLAGITVNSNVIGYGIVVFNNSGANLTIDGDIGTETSMVARMVFAAPTILDSKGSIYISNGIIGPAGTLSLTGTAAQTIAAQLGAGSTSRLAELDVSNISGEGVALNGDAYLTKLAFQNASGTSTVTIASGKTLDVLTSIVNGVDGSSVVKGAGTLALGGTLGQTVNSNLGTGTGERLGALTTKLGATGVINLNAASYLGNLTVDAASVGTTTISNSAALDVSGTFTVNATTALAGDGAKTFGTTTINGGSILTLNSGATIATLVLGTSSTVNIADSKIATITGNVSGTGGFIKGVSAGVGTLSLTGTVGQAIEAKIGLAENRLGELDVSNISGEGVALNNNAYLNTLAFKNYSGNSAVIIANQKTLDVSGNITQVIGGDGVVGGSGGIYLTGGAQTIAAKLGASTSSRLGVLAVGNEYGSAITLNKEVYLKNLAAQTLTSFTSTIINNNTLDVSETFYVQGNTTLGGAGDKTFASTNVSSEKTLNLASNATGANNFGATTLQSASILNIDRNATLASLTTTNNNYNVGSIRNNGATLTVSGDFSVAGFGTTTVAGTGTNNFGGTTTINYATLTLGEVGIGANIFNGATTLNGSILNINGATTTFNGTTLNDSSLNINAGINTFNGTTTLNGTSTLTVGSSATLAALNIGALGKVIINSEKIATIIGNVFEAGAIQGANNGVGTLSLTGTAAQTIAAQLGESNSARLGGLDVGNISSNGVSLNNNAFLGTLAFKNTSGKATIVIDAGKTLDVSNNITQAGGSSVIKGSGTAILTSASVELSALQLGTGTTDRLGGLTIRDTGATYTDINKDTYLGNLTFSNTSGTSNAIIANGKTLDISGNISRGADGSFIIKGEAADVGKVVLSGGTAAQTINAQLGVGLDARIAELDVNNNAGVTLQNAAYLGTLKITGASTITNNNTLNANVFSVDNNTTLAGNGNSSFGATTIAANKNLTVDALGVGASTTFNGTTTLGSSSTLNLNSSATFSGITTLNSASTLNLNSSATIATLALGTSGTVNIAKDQTATITNVSGTGTVQGEGTASLSAALASSGVKFGSSVDSRLGTLAISDTDTNSVTIGNNAFVETLAFSNTSGTATVNISSGKTLDVLTSIVNGVNGSSVVKGAGTLALGGTLAQTVSSKLGTGTTDRLGALTTKLGATGVINLNAASYLGNLTVDAASVGTTTISNSAALDAATFSVNADTTLAGAGAKTFGTSGNATTGTNVANEKTLTLSAGAATFNGTTTLGSSSTLNLNSSATIEDLALGTSGTVNIAKDQTATISGITGTGTVQGEGTASLSAALASSGVKFGSSVDSRLGTLAISDTDTNSVTIGNNTFVKTLAFSNTSGTTTVNISSGKTLDVLTSIVNGVDGSSVFKGAGTLALGGTLGQTVNSNLGTGTGDRLGALTTKLSATGVINLNAASYLGNLTVDAASVGTTTISNSAALDVSGTFTVNATTALAGDGAKTFGTTNITGGKTLTLNAVSGTANFGATTLTDASTLTTNSTTNLTSLATSGTGIATITNNDYELTVSGIFTVDENTNLNGGGDKTFAVTNINGKILTLNAGTTNFGITTLTGASTLTTNSTTNLTSLKTSGSGTANINNNANALTVSGVFTVGENTNLNGDGNKTFAATSITAGTLTLASNATGNNIFNGTTTINNGSALALNANADISTLAFGTGNGAVNVAANQTATITGNVYGAGGAIQGATNGVGILSFAGATGEQNVASGVTLGTSSNRLDKININNAAGVTFGNAYTNILAFSSNDNATIAAGKILNVSGNITDSGTSKILGSNATLALSGSTPQAIGAQLGTDESDRLGTLNIAGNNVVTLSKTSFINNLTFFNSSSSAASLGIKTSIVTLGSSGFKTLNDTAPTLTIGSGQTLDVSGNITAQNTATIINGAGILNLNGTTTQTIGVGLGSSVSRLGTLTINNSAGAVLTQNSYLTWFTTDGPLTIINSASLDVVDPISLSGKTLNLVASSAANPFGSLKSGSNIDLTGTTINFDYSGNNAAINFDPTTIMTATGSISGVFTSNDNSFLFNNNLALSADEKTLTSTFKKDTTNFSASNLGSDNFALLNNALSSKELAANIAGITSKKQLDSGVKTLKPSTNEALLNTSLAINDGTNKALGLRLQQISSNLIGFTTSKQFDDKIWGQVLGGKAQQGKVQDSSGYMATTGGLMFGKDHLFKGEQNIVLGGAIAYQRAGITGDDKNQSQVSSYQAMIYSNNSSYSGLGLYNNNIFNLAKNQYTSSRNISIGALNKDAKADFGGRSYSLKSDVGYNIKVNEALLFSPNIGLKYLALSQDGYQEKGAGDSGLKVKQLSFSSINYAIGFNLASKFQDRNKNFTYIPKFTTSFERSLTGSNPSASFSFIGGGETMKQKMLIQDSKINVGLAMNIFNDEANSSFQFEYNLQLATQFVSNNISAQYKYAF